MPDIQITTHAVQRFQERVANWPDDRVRAAIASPVVRRAADFGAPFVKLGTGQRIVLDGHTVVTVLPADHYPASLDPRRRPARSAPVPQ